ncbi:MAG: hypothetical protein KKA07_07260 [Bacteroidetes bacterium]|nr:hypothetical protein [Bacteroidota bacterium]MBU1718858.1 hypothetical protein [Bacteroidota bacterium]
MKYTLPALLVFFLAACGSGDPGTASDLLSDSLLNRNEARISDKQVIEIITSIPNPVEMSSLLQKCGVIYSNDLLNPAGNISKYNTNYKKALNLGTYGTDLVHMNIFDRTTSSLEYLNNIKDLAGDLKVGQFFDHETLTRLSENSKNVDSILFITNSGFDRMSNFLQEQNRTSVSVLIGIGTWVESLYLATNIEKATNKDEVFNRIGEQKEVLDMIIIMLSAFADNEEFKDLMEDIRALKIIFDKVKISYTYAEPTMKEIDGVLVIVDNSTSSVAISEEIFNEISTKISAIRTKIIN